MKENIYCKECNSYFTQKYWIYHTRTQKHERFTETHQRSTENSNALWKASRHYKQPQRSTRVEESDLVVRLPDRVRSGSPAGVTTDRCV